LNSITTELRFNVEQREEAESRAIHSRNAADSAREASDLAQRFAHAEVQGLQASLNSEQQSHSVLSERLVLAEAAKQATEDARRRSEVEIELLEACKQQLEDKLAAHAAKASEAAQSKEALELMRAGHVADSDRTLQEVAELRHQVIQQQESHAAAATDMAESRHELELSVASQAATATEELIADIRTAEAANQAHLEAVLQAQADAVQIEEAAAFGQRLAEQEQKYEANMDQLESLLARTQRDFEAIQHEARQAQKMLGAQRGELQVASERAVDQTLQIEALIQQAEEQDEERQTVRRASRQLELDLQTCASRRMELDALRSTLKEERGSCEVQEQEVTVARAELRRSKELSLAQVQELGVSLAAAKASQHAPHEVDAFTALEQKVRALHEDVSRRQQVHMAEVIEAQRLREQLKQQEAACCSLARGAEADKAEVMSIRSLMRRERESAATQAQELQCKALADSGRALETVQAVTQDLTARLESQQERCQSQASELQALHAELSESRAERGALNNELDSWKRNPHAGPEDQKPSRQHDKCPARGLICSYMETVQAMVCCMRANGNANNVRTSGQEPRRAKPNEKEPLTEDLTRDDIAGTGEAPRN